MEYIYSEKKNDNSNNINKAKGYASYISLHNQPMS